MTKKRVGGEKRIGQGENRTEMKGTYGNAPGNKRMARRRK